MLCFFCCWQNSDFIWGFLKVGINFIQFCRFLQFVQWHRGKTRIGMWGDIMIIRYPIFTMHRLSPQPRLQMQRTCHSQADLYGNNESQTYNSQTPGGCTMPSMWVLPSMRYNVPLAFKSYTIYWLACHTRCMWLSYVLVLSSSHPVMRGGSICCGCRKHFLFTFFWPCHRSVQRVAQVPDETMIVSVMRFQLIRPSFDCFSLDERFLWHHLLFAPIRRLQCIPPKSQGPDILTWASAPRWPSIGRAVSLSSVTTPACLWGNYVFMHTFCTIAFWGSCIKHRSSESHCVYHVFEPYLSCFRVCQTQDTRRHA